MKNDEKMALHLPAEFAQAGAVTILTGDAPKPLLPPQALAYAGRLDTPRRFHEPKQDNYAPLQCTFEVDSEANSVRFIGFEKSHESADVITGALVPSEALRQFKLNTGDRWTIAQLVELVKRMRPYFATQEAQLALLTRLRNWSIAVTKTYEEMTSLEGNARKLALTKVEGAAPDSFKLHLPIYKGYPKETFEVEFGVEADGAGVKLYMDSPQLLDLLLEKKEQYLKTEVDYFTAWGCSVIWRS